MDGWDLGGEAGDRCPAGGYGDTIGVFGCGANQPAVSGWRSGKLSSNTVSGHGVLDAASAGPGLAVGEGCNVVAKSGASAGPGLAVGEGCKVVAESDVSAGPGLAVGEICKLELGPVSK